MAGSNPLLAFSWTIKDVMTFLSLVLIYITTRESGWEWEQEKWKSSSHYSSVSPSWSAKLKNSTNRPQFTLEKSSEWSGFNFLRFEPGSLKKVSLSFSISLVDIVKFFAVKRYQENLTRSKERERPILTKIKTNTHWRKVKTSTHFITFTNKACFECH